MKSVKIIFLFSLLLSLVTFSSCKKKGCTDTFAFNFSLNAEKDDGSCEYTASDFLGTFYCSKICNFANNSNYEMSIFQGPKQHEILMSNFGGFGSTVKASTLGNKLTFKDNDGTVVYNGTGTIYGDELYLEMEICSLYVSPCANPDYCNSNGTRY